MQYDKLVRDRIPQIIQDSGKIAVTAPVKDIDQALDRKLREETDEYLESHSPEEMADILEVLHGIAYHAGMDWDALEALRLKKRAERGGFEKGIRLLEVRDK